MRRLLPLLLLVPAAAFLVAAGRPVTRYEVASGSRFWIDGTSTMGAYRCNGSRIAGSGDVEPPRVAAELTIPVASFDCGQSRMNRDFRAALHGATHPTIRFTVDRAVALQRESRPGAWVRVRATGRLRLAGTERPIELEAQGRRRSDGRVQIRGAHPMQMTDYGIDPPTGLGGLVRAHDRLVARFDLLATVR